MYEDQKIRELGVYPDEEMITSEFPVELGVLYPHEEMTPIEFEGVYSEEVINQEMTPIEFEGVYSEEVINQEMSNFEKKLDSEKKLNLVAWQLNDTLHSAVSFDQYFIEGKKLITVIGEYHQQEFGCADRQTLSIAEYAIKVVNRNPKAKILLEYQPGWDPSDINSIPIRDISIEVPDRAMAFDRRWEFLTRALEDLYKKNLVGYTHQKIHQVFIDSYFQGLNENKFQIDKNLYDKDTCTYLDKVYIRDLTSNFLFLSNTISNQKNINTVILPKLQHIWKKVADFFILKEILKNTDLINEYVVVVGEYHRQNIASILNRFRINTQTGQEGDCVELFSTFIVN